ncbi:hypothetical protein ACMA5I_02220 [Paracoccaceae bacterium GXU_MW_L88]
MLKKLLPVVALLLGLGAGIAGASFTKSAPPEACVEEEESCEVSTEPQKDSEPDADALSYLPMEEPFILPDLKDGRVSSMITIAITLEIEEEEKETIEKLMPKLRDHLLKDMMDHAASGGFRDSFGTGAAMADLRAKLLASAKDVSHNEIKGILITDAIRQDN